MIKGLNLTLLIGPGAPLPASRIVMDALQSVQVVSESGNAQSGFELSFSIERNSPLTSLFLISGGQAVRLFRVVLIVTLNGKSEVLINGVATQTQVAPRTGGGPATLSVQGKDMTAAMDILPFNGVPYPAMAPDARVRIILGKYAFLGVVPMVIPTIGGAPVPTDQFARHIDTDLAYVQKLAEEQGYIFRMEPSPAPGVNIAYWGPEIHFGIPQAALTIDSGHADNVESLSFRVDKESAEIPVVFIHNRETGAPLPVPIPNEIPFLPPLGAVPPLPPKITFLGEAAPLKPLDALVRGFAHAAQHSKAVQGSGSLDVLRYGRVLRAGRPVGVRGAGLPFDGLHYVEQVTSNLTRHSFKQDFSLTRNGLLPTVERVAV